MNSGSLKEESNSVKINNAVYCEILSALHMQIIQTDWIQMCVKNDMS